MDGLIGITQAKVGEYVGRSPNPVVLNVVSQTDPIRVRFSINERDYLRFNRSLSRDLRELDQRDAGRQNLQLILADGSVHEYAGSLVSFDATIDPGTGTLTLEADFPNPDRLVLAGQFARVRGRTERREDALAIPQSAVVETQGLFQLAVIGRDGSVELRRVEMGPRVDKMWIVDSGLEAGEWVALDGLQRLRTGMKVVPKQQSADSTPGE